MTYRQIREEKEKRVSQTIEDCKMFFAFSNQQFEKNKTELKEGEQYANLGMGAFMPKGYVEDYVKKCEELTQWEIKTIAENNLDDACILYELCNHEAFYTGEIEDTHEALGGRYTEERIWEVYRSNYEKHADN